jgi:hypothetical protein
VAEITFDVKAAESYARRYAYDSAREITKQTTAAFRSVVSKAITKTMQASAAEIAGIVSEEVLWTHGMQVTPQMRSSLAKQMLGLDRRRAHAALEYRAQLIREGLPAKKVREKFGIEVRKKLRSRARTIGRTEASQALASGKRETWRQQIKSGELTRASVRVIDVTLDGKTCPICQRMAGRRYPLMNKAGKLGAFKVRNKVSKGEVVGKRFKWFRSPPFHVNCRCTSHIE